MPAPPDPLPQTIGPYRVLGELGRGGMGVVYRCEDPSLIREVAVKLMLPAVAGNPKSRRRFVREGQAQAKVEHDHVVPIYGVGEADGSPYLVMPLLRGQPLADFLTTYPRPPVAEAVRVASQMAVGLGAAHARGSSTGT